MNDLPLSIVIPVYNEVDSLRELHARVTEVCASCVEDFEVLFVDDGSTDGSLGVLRALADENPEQTGVVELRRNFGKAAALDAGFRQARGNVLITLDADLQDDPDEIPRFLSRLEEGADLVSGWKQHREDPLDKTLPSKLFNRVVSRVSGLRLHDFNCGYKAYRRETVEGLSLYGELHRFIPVLAHWQGYRVAEMPVTHHARLHGHSKYGTSRLIKGFFDLLTVLLLTRFVTRPLHLFGGLGLFFGALGVLILSYLTVLWFADAGPIGNRPLLFLGMLLTMVGVQFVCTGLVAEMITRQQNQDTPTYVLRSIRAPRKPHH